MKYKIYKIYKSALAGLTALAVVPVALAGGVLRLDEVAVGELDPAKASDYADSMLMYNVYDALVLPKQGAPGHAPHLAKDWSIDGNSYTFTLRDDVRFHSGNRLTADDVVFSLERMQTLGSGLSHLFGDVESVVANSSHSVTFNLNTTYSPFISALARLPIIDKQTVMANLGDGDGPMKDWGQVYLSGNSAGSGAYRVEAHNPQQETVMAKNADYFLSVPAVAPDTVRLRYGLEAATVRTLIAQGEHDIASQWLPPEVIRALVDDGVQLLTEGGTGALYFKLNTTKPPLDDVNCRLALTKALDYQTVVGMLAITDDISQGSPSTGAIPVGMYGSNPSGQVLRRDLAAAKQHAEDCRYNPADHTIELSWIAEVPIEERFALLLQVNFAEVGFKSEIRKIPWALFTERVAKPENTPHLSQLFVNSVSGDPDTLLYGMYHSSVPGTWQSPEYLSDAQVDELLEQGRQLAEPSQRQQAYADLNSRLTEIAPTIYAFDRQSVFAASNRVRVPALSDPDHAFGLDGMGFTFRLMEMVE